MDYSPWLTIVNWLTIINHHQPSLTTHYSWIFTTSAPFDPRPGHPLSPAPRCFPRASPAPPPALCGGRASARLWRWDGVACWGHPPPASVAFDFTVSVEKNTRKWRKLKEAPVFLGGTVAAFASKYIGVLIDYMNHIKSLGWVGSENVYCNTMPRQRGSCRFSLQFWEWNILHRIIDFKAPTGKYVGYFVCVENWVFRFICWQGDGGLVLMNWYLTAMIFHQKLRTECSLNPDRWGELNGRIHTQSILT